MSRIITIIKQVSCPRYELVLIGLPNDKYRVVKVTENKKHVSTNLSDYRIADWLFESFLETLEGGVK